MRFPLAKEWCIFQETEQLITQEVLNAWEILIKYYLDIELLANHQVLMVNDSW